ncbi:hypothetical protein TNCV_3520671 [Trichonephila clavipes]|nr:hypothetical protein TNCV_3520671 [Trichonephila clavipes]
MSEIKPTFIREEYASPILIGLISMITTHCKTKHSTRKSRQRNTLHGCGVGERYIKTSHYEAARGILATDLIILNYGQVTPELAPPSPNFHTNGRKLDRFNVQRSPLHSGSSVALDSNTWHASHESVTLITELPR